MLEGVIHFVEDEDTSYWLIESALAALNMSNRGHRNAEDLLRNLSESTSLVFMDLSLPGLGGLECVRQLAKSHPQIPVVIISASNKPAVISEAISAGATWFIHKPFDLAEFQSSIENALLLKTQKKLTQNACVDFASGSFGVALRKAARSNCSILLRGEHGTGKSTLARTIHDMSLRRDFGFVSVSCANIPKELFESELFGFEKGSFTGATSTRPGLVELAHQGTLFLDEIGDLPFDLQAKLLTFLQERRATRLGGRLDRELDVRVIAATNQNLEQLIQVNRFRVDLFYRLNVVSILVPPLRERREDLNGIAETLLKKVCVRNGITTKPLSKKARDLLMSYSFPGNVRELENILERAAIMSDSSEILCSDIHIPEEHESKETLADRIELSSTGQSLEEIEQSSINNALLRHGGNRARAAHELGITERTLYNKLRAGKV